jgi:hypothetical protein
VYDGDDFLAFCFVHKYVNSCTVLYIYIYIYIYIYLLFSLVTKLGQQSPVSTSRLYPSVQYIIKECLF